jgi:chemotaxis protein CheZ
MQMNISNVVENRDMLLEQVRALQKSLEDDDHDEISNLMEQLSHSHEDKLFQELGKLTRDLHEALGAFRSDERLANIADGEITDAKERLNYVIEMTDKAATSTLGAIEEIQPMCDKLGNRSGSLLVDLQRFLDREMERGEFNEFCRELTDFLPTVGARSTDINSKLSEVLMAQSFQDLSGQLIRKVILLVEEVETGLVDMIRISGQGQLSSADDTDAMKLDGPQVPALQSAEAVSGQDEVDDLLSSLGF